MLFFMGLIFVVLIWALIMAGYMSFYEVFEEHRMESEKAGYYAAAVVALLIGIVVATISCDAIGNVMMRNTKERIETTNGD